MTTKQKPKPRLSIKLLWKLIAEWQIGLSVGENRELGGAYRFVEFVEKEMKPLKP